jgi:hypothetical protein
MIATTSFAAGLATDDKANSSAQRPFFPSAMLPHAPRATGESRRSNAEEREPRGFWDRGRHLGEADRIFDADVYRAFIEGSGIQEAAIVVPRGIADRVRSVNRGVLTPEQAAEGRIAAHERGVGELVRPRRAHHSQTRHPDGVLKEAGGAVPPGRGLSRRADAARDDHVSVTQ